MILIGTVVLAFSSALTAADLCTGPFAPLNVVGLTFSCGSVSFSNFSVTPASPATVSPEIDLTHADSTGGSVNLTFNPNLSAPIGPQDIYFRFQVDGGISQVSLGVGGMNATVIETACSVPIPTTGPGANMCPTTALATLIAFSPPATSTAVSSFGGTPTVFIFKDVGVATGGGLTTLNQSFSMIPEPGSMILFGTGLIALATITRWLNRSTPS